MFWQFSLITGLSQESYCFNFPIPPAQKSPGRLPKSFCPWQSNHGLASQLQFGAAVRLKVVENVMKKTCFNLVWKFGIELVVKTWWKMKLGMNSWFDYQKEFQALPIFADILDVYQQRVPSLNVFVKVLCFQIRQPQAPDEGSTGDSLGAWASERFCLYEIDWNWAWYCKLPCLLYRAVLFGICTYLYYCSRIVVTTTKNKQTNKQKINLANHRIPPSWRNFVPTQKSFDDRHPKTESPCCPVAVCIGTEQMWSKQKHQIITDYHRSSQIITDHHRSSQIITDHHRSSQIITDHHRSSQIITNHHRSSQIITDHHRSHIIEKRYAKNITNTSAASAGLLVLHRWRTGILVFHDLLSPKERGFLRDNVNRFICFTPF